MEGITNIILSLLIILCSSLSTHSAATEQNTLFIRNSCSSTAYPRLCYSSLVKHAEVIQTNRVVLTGTALNVTLASAKATSAIMSSLAKSVGLKPRDAAAMKDCVEELGDAVDELRRSIEEMGHLGPSNFEMTMGDVQTWVSAALTDESTCTDGFEETAANDFKTTVRARVVQLAQLTSNALAFINQLANSR